MTQDEIIALAKRVGFPIQHPEWRKAVEEFAALVEEQATAKEREECAKVCDDKHDTWRWDDEADSASGPRDCAAAIRARGQA